MSARLAYLFRWDGTVDRGPYLAIGLLGFALKHNLDRFLATFVFHRPWELFNYWIPPTKALRLRELPREDAFFLAAMLGLALPFIWVGVALTARRLRAVRLPTWLVALFFLPVANLVFFLVLSVLPSRPEAAPPALPRTRRFQAFLDRVIPDDPVGSSVMALLITLPLGVGATLLSTSVFVTYGWSLFVGLPFVLGLAAALLHGYHGSRSYGSCLAVSWLSILFTGVILFALAVEGLICIVMAAPMGVVLAAAGGSVGYLIQSRPWSQGEVPSAFLVLTLVTPGLMGAEALERPQPPLFAVRTTIEVQTAPEVVWQRVVSFTELPEPDDWFFRLGIAYPMRAEITGRGVGAVRQCVFSTGTFVEPIEIWDAPRRLKFSVTSNPAPMQEWTPYRTIAPAHLDGFLVSRGGEFLLVPLPTGHTRIEATTWYHHHMWPAAYWRLWSDAIIHRIHTRVLRHVKHLAEENRGG